jgi:hypothetical protein
MGATFRAEWECPSPEYPLKAEDNAAGAKSGSSGEKLPNLGSQKLCPNSPAPGREQTFEKIEPKAA